MFKTCVVIALLIASSASAQIQGLSPKYEQQDLCEQVRQGRMPPEDLVLKHHYENWHNCWPTDKCARLPTPEDRQLCRLGRGYR